MTRKKATKTEELLAGERQWAQGRASDPLASRELAAHFLRAYRGHADYARAVSEGQKSHFAERLEQARCLILQGDGPAARRALGELTHLDPVELAEYWLEQARIHMLSEEYSDALKCLESALSQEEVSEVTRLTCHQLAASLHLKQGHPERALEDLKLALAIAEVFDVVASAFSARAYLVQAYAELGRVAEAQQALSALQGMLDRLESDELWTDRRLTVLRAECQLARLTRNVEAWRSYATEARELARWIGDQPCRAKCEQELGDIARLTGKQPPCDGIKPVEYFRGWTYLPRLKLILHEDPRTVVRLDGRPIAEKILQALGEQALSKSALFEKVWGITFHSERHTPHLMAILSKVRKLLPPSSLVVEEGLVELRR